MSNLLSLEFRAKSAIDQSKKFSAHDARRRTTKTKSDGCISRAERVKLVPKAGSSNTLSAGFLAFAKPTYSIQRHPSLNREPCEQSKKPEHISCVRKLVRKLVGA